MDVRGSSFNVNGNSVTGASSLFALFEQYDGQVPRGMILAVQGIVTGGWLFLSASFSLVSLR